MAKESIFDILAERIAGTDIPNKEGVSHFCAHCGKETEGTAMPRSEDEIIFICKECCKATSWETDEEIDL